MISSCTSLAAICASTINFLLWQTRKLIVEAQIAAKEVHEEIIRLIYPDGSF